MSNRVGAAHYHDLDAVLRAAWSMLERGVGDRKAEFHIAQVATIDDAGSPSIRSVVLRGFDRDRHTLRFHTDSRSCKVTEIQAQPALAVHFYDRTEKLQLRLSCHAKVHTRDDVTAAAWEAMRPMSRECYGQHWAPGTQLREPDLSSEMLAKEVLNAFDNFAVVIARIHTLQWLYLSSSGHRRARFDFRAGQEMRTWLAP